MLPFDHSDFARDAKKYGLFRTAKVARHIISEPTFNAGEYVALRFFGVRRNQLFRRDEPVYEITATDGRSTYAYAAALADFCL